MADIVLGPLSSPLVPQVMLCPHLYCLSSERLSLSSLVSLSFEMHYVAFGQQLAFCLGVQNSESSLSDFCLDELYPLPPSGLTLKTKMLSLQKLLP